MNTIPLIFNERQINVTILGGKDIGSGSKNRIGVILLNKSGSHYRLQTLENLVRCGFDSIVSIEKDPKNYNIEEFCQNYPSAKFVVPLDEVTDGDCINLGMAELNTEYVLVLRDTLNLNGEILNQRIAETLLEEEFFCTAPRLLKNNGQSFPITFSPDVKKSRFEVAATSSVFDGIQTLFPFDNIGLYNRKKFIQLGGYDYTIKNKYYQNLDLSMRAWLWGEKIRISAIFNMRYLDEPPVEDTSPSLYSSRFYLKNLLPHFEYDHGVIKRSGFFLFYPRSGCGVFEAMDQFGQARYWVKQNKYRFKCDASYLLQNWGK